MSGGGRRADDARDGPESGGASLPERESRLPALLGDLAPRTGSLLLALLAVFPPALGLVGAAAAYETSGSLGMALLGLAFGAATGLAWSRDFARWRLGLLTLATTLVFATLFGWAYLVPT